MGLATHFLELTEVNADGTKRPLVVSVDMVVSVSPYFASNVHSRAEITLTGGFWEGRRFVVTQSYKQVRELLMALQGRKGPEFSN